MSLLRAIDVCKDYRTYSLVGASAGKRVLDTVSLTIAEGETVALLGRSGCGKSTLARLLVGLERPTSGQVLFRDKPVAALARRELAEFRRQVQLVFQDSPGAVNARFTVRAIVSEPLRHLTALDEIGREARIRELLDMVELPAGIADMLPSQVSGGQLQRVCIARALAVGPKLVILDEAVSNLDTHLQASALALLERLQAERGVSYLFVTHDLRLVRRFASRCLVMDDGRIVEEVADPSSGKMKHPASRLLSEAVLPPMPLRTAAG
ncbi:Ni(2(+)) ABC transporter ATP binding subunit NikE [Hyphomicrobiales bacterium]|nr:Ni(2(+)) ABC transporter ATP binding subunit NikE [Hyphomicrobiales bacterium]CAH1698872.1 Ni(2(+)) ABC transporter ATP binding subunit NikE [Hyphomicrobiales bacterium]CAI0342516.1 Ni(2(+)) ABC transporter ATP binding subunit NikE [Hyphomicrobiales bacterium]